MSEITFTLSAGLDRSIVWHRGKSVRYLVAEVGAQGHSQQAAHEPKPVNLALVIDTSGSMAGGKLHCAKEAAMGVVHALGRRDRLSIISFADQASVHTDHLLLEEGAQRQALDKINGLTANDSTNLSEGWLSGAECVAGAMDNRSTVINRVVVLSDGMANRGITDPQILAEHAAQLRLRGIATSTVGIGDDYQAPLLQTLSENGGGQMHDAELSEEIIEVVMGELRDTQNIAIENITLGLFCPTDVEAGLVGSYPSTAVPGHLEVFMGSLSTQQSRHAVIRLTLPARPAGTTIEISTSARGAMAGTNHVIESELRTLGIEFAEGAKNDAQPRDIDRSLRVAKVWHAEVIRRASRMNRDEQNREAMQYLGREVRFFERYCHGLPETENLVKDLILLLRRVDTPWEERTRKEMELAALKLSTSQREYRTRSRRQWQDRF